MISELSSVIGLLSIGIDSTEINNSDRVSNVLNNINTPSPIFLNNNNENNLNLSPSFSITDDDTLDIQIPSSWGSSSDPSSSKLGGYFSLLLPVTLSLSKKHGLRVPAGLVCEGHRVGLTSYSQPNDNYSSLNQNGLSVKWLHDTMGWNVINHSMTAQLPIRTFYVDGIDSSLADTILENGTYAGELSFYNTIVFDRLAGKWYEVNSTLTGWNERIPNKKYQQLYYQDYNTNQWYFNRNFDADYNWGEWFKRAKELGLPFENIIAFNGNTISAYTIAMSRKWTQYCLGYETGSYNYPPIHGDICRVGLPSGNDNVYDVSVYERITEILDDVKLNNSWLCFVMHCYEKNYSNHYYEEYTYEEKDPDYPSEWEVPLKYQEIIDLVNGSHDYITTTPTRLQISSWDEWKPAPGTRLRMAYDLFDYALENGIKCITPYEGCKIFANIVDIGVNRGSKQYYFDRASNVTSIYDYWKNHSLD